MAFFAFARETGITRDGLYKALSPTGNPSFATVQKVVYALGQNLALLYTVVYNNLMVEIKRTDEFAKWLNKLKDINAKARINLRIRRISLTDNLGDFKSVGGGVFELRVDFGPGYRIYFSRRGVEVILLLIGGDKSTQQRDIAKAQQLDKQYE